MGLRKIFGFARNGKQHPSQRWNLFFQWREAPFPLHCASMKRSPTLFAVTGAFALIGALLLPQPSIGQAPAAAADAGIAQLLTEVAAQQATILENHGKIDEKIAAIGEDVRVARIFVGRGGGKAK